MNAPWEKKRPEKLGKPQRLTPDQKQKAKQAAAAAGRPYPNLVDNMNAAKRSNKLAKAMGLKK